MWKDVAVRWKKQVEKGYDHIFIKKNMGMEKSLKGHLLRSGW